jgi:hypothetical protein
LATSINLSYFLSLDWGYGEVSANSCLASLSSATKTQRDLASIDLGRRKSAILYFDSI